MLRRLKSYCTRKLLQILSGQLGQLWICLTVISILYVTLQITGVLQQSRCDQELKALLLQQISGIQQSIRFQKVPPHESLHNIQQSREKSLVDTTSTISTGDFMELMELSKEFVNSNGLSNDPENLQEPERKRFLEENSEMWLLYSDSKTEADFQNSNMKSGIDNVAVTRAPSISGVSSSAPANADLFIRASAAADRMDTDKFIETTPLGKDEESSHAEHEANVYFSLNRTNNYSKNATMANQRSIKPGEPKADKKENLKPINSPLQKYEMFLQEKLTSPKSVAEPAELRGAQSQSFLSNYSTSHNCKPQTHIVFLKVHKSASSTIMNILFRFGETHNLTFALPYNRAAQMFYPHYFMASFVEGFSPNKMTEFNIMCHHMRFLQTEVQKVMPSDTFYFSILRNPFHLVESSFAYYKSASPFSRAKTLDEFLDQPLKFYKASNPNSHYARNLMTFDFGFNPNGNSSARHAQLNIEAIENMFDLILITEYFDESMVLLKEALCWNLDDVVYFPLNSRNEKTRVPLSKSHTEKLKSWNKLDWELYIYFNRTFWERIDQTIGREKMQQEVKELRKRREELARTCLQGEGMVDPLQIKDLSLVPLQYGKARILGYNLKPGLGKVTRQLCQSLVTPELQYSSFLYERQFPKKASEPQRHTAAKISPQYFNPRNNPWKHGKKRDSIKKKIF
ncbi:uncharacterized protein LOC115099495 [Rhinatrema bivittatum]|uniref:uncharacterized protein LOC115099495 n=1 Tax=Rhinatrema bivittatum TaxID=194408 RepID=UPI00112ED850|nr:uncharacterized protein LOC115099495 [Rhinatrema bivittatum]